MDTGFVQSHIVRGNRNILRVGLLLILGGVLVSALFWHWFPLVSVVVGVMMLGLWLRRILNPREHPVYHQLARYGDAHQVAQHIDQEFAGVPASDALHFGATWLAQGKLYGVDVVPWQEIAWLHLYSRRSVGVVTTHYVRVWSRDGQQFLSPANLKGYRRVEQAEALLRELHARAPWAEAGFSPTLQMQWQRQRAEFVKRVDARRATGSAAS